MAERLYADGDIKTQVDGKIAKSLLTSKGDTIIHDGSAPARKPVSGTDNNVMTEDSTDAQGAAWKASQGGGSLIEGLDTFWWYDQDLFAYWSGDGKPLLYKDGEVFGYAWDKYSTNDGAPLVVVEGSGGFSPSNTGYTGVVSPPIELDFGKQEHLDITGLDYLGDHRIGVGYQSKIFTLAFAADSPDGPDYLYPVGARSNDSGVGHYTGYYGYYCGQVVPVDCTLVAVRLYFSSYFYSGDAVEVYKNGSQVFNSNPVAEGAASGTENRWTSYGAADFSAGDAILVRGDNMSGDFMCILYFVHSEDKPLWPLVFGGVHRDNYYLTAGAEGDPQADYSNYGRGKRIVLPMPGTPKYYTGVYSTNTSAGWYIYKNNVNTGALVYRGGGTSFGGGGYRNHGSVSSPPSFVAGDDISLRANGAVGGYGWSIIWMETDPADL